MHLGFISWSLLSFTIIWSVPIIALGFAENVNTTNALKRCLLHPDQEFKSLAGNIKNQGTFMSHVTIKMTKEPQQWDNCSVGFQFEDEDIVDLTLTSEPILDKWILTSYYEDFYYVEHKSNLSFASAGKYRLYFENNTVLTFYNVPPSKNATLAFVVYKPDSITLTINEKEFVVCVEYLNSHSLEASDYLQCSDVHNHDIKKTDCNVTSVSLNSTFNSANINISVPYTDDHFTDYWIKCKPDIESKKFAVSYPFTVVGNSLQHFVNKNLAIIVTIILFLIFVTAISILYVRFKKKVYNEKLGYVKRIPNLTKLTTWPLQRQITQELSLDDSMSMTASQQHLEWDPEHWPDWVPKANLMRFPRSDINFDDQHPLGSGLYGFVFNGTIKYGYTR